MIRQIKAGTMVLRRPIRSSRSGSALIEYAMLAPVFFLTIMGLVEFVLYQYKAYTLNYITYEAARKVQTGSVQEEADVAQAFRDAACDAAGAMISCATIDFDVRAFDALGEITYPEVTFDPETGRPLAWAIAPGGANQYSVVRASITHTFITPFMGELFHMGPELPAILSAFVIVRNEPWA